MQNNKTGFHFKTQKPITFSMLFQEYIFYSTLCCLSVINMQRAFEDNDLFVLNVMLLYVFDMFDTIPIFE